MNKVNNSENSVTTTTTCKQAELYVYRSSIYLPGGGTLGFGSLVFSCFPFCCCGCSCSSCECCGLTRRLPCEWFFALLLLLSSWLWSILLLSLLLLELLSRLLLLSYDPQAKCNGHDFIQIKLVQPLSTKVWHFWRFCSFMHGSSSRIGHVDAPTVSMVKRSGSNNNIVTEKKSMTIQSFALYVFQPLSNKKNGTRGSK